MAGWFSRRYLDLLGSIYIYNEHRGYTAIDRVLEAIRARSPDDHELIAAVESHRADERKHYVMFRRWFERLCRVISLTEQRGYKQVEILLDHKIVKTDPVLIRIFEIIKKDEPSHWAPYDGWLRANARRDPKWWERAVDTFIHSELLFLKLPVLFLNPWLGRRTDWADDGDPAERLASPIQAAA